MPLPPGRVGHLAAADVDRTTGGGHQGTGQQQPAPLVPPPALAVDFPWRPILINGGDHLDDGPKPLFRALDFTHVALSETTGELWLSDPTSIVKPDRGDEAVQGLGRTTFPYLQLHPPHCQSCMG